MCAWLEKNQILATGSQQMKRKQSYLVFIDKDKQVRFKARFKSGHVNLALSHCRMLVESWSNLMQHIDAW